DADDLLAAENTSTMGFDLDFFVRLLGHLRKSIDIDADRKATCDDLAIFDLDAVVLHLVVELVFHIVLEIAQVGVRLEADYVELEQALDQPAVFRHGREYLGRREGDMKEEADPLLAAALTQFSCQRNQVVIVDPDYVLRLENGHQGIGEFGVHTAIAVEEGCLVLHQIQPIMKERPENAIGKP